MPGMRSRYGSGLCPDVIRVVEAEKEQEPHSSGERSNQRIHQGSSGPSALEWYVIN